MEQAKQSFPNLLIANETIKSTYNSLKAIVDELKDLGVLVNENLANFQQELESIHHFCQGDYKFSFLIQGEMNAGKSTCLNALLGERLLAVSSVPETNFLTCVIPDRGVQTPMLYNVPLSKLYNSYTSSFHVNETDLVFTGVSGAENIFKHLNGSNQASREKLKEAQENPQSNQNLDQKVKELYKDAELHDTVYIIKCRIPWIEEKIKDEFILKRIQFIDFPGMFEYGHKKISEIYKVFEDNSQGVIHILHPLGYQSKATTKLQHYKKYPERMMIIINKMDQINLNEEGAQDEENDSSSLNAQEKAEGLVKNFENFLKKNSENSSDDAQKTKYLEMSQEVKTILNFVTGKEEAMKQYVLKYRESKTQQEKDLWDGVLKECVEDDQTYKGELKRAKKQNKPFAEMDLFDDFIENENNLFVKLQDNLKDKFLNRFSELVTLDMPKKLNSIREQLLNMIEKIIKQKDVNAIDKQKQEADNNTHSFVRCDGCEANPLVGVRYHCKVCDDFDFCETCKQTKQHPEHEFQVIPKEDLKSFMYDFSIKSVIASFKAIEDFREQFNAQLMELVLSLGEIFKTGNNDVAVETLLKTHYTRYKTLKEEAAAKIEQIQEEVAGFGSLIALKWGATNGIVALLAGIEAEKIMMSLFDTYKIFFALLLTGCAHLFQAIATTTMKKSSQLLIQSFYEGVDVLSNLLKNPYDMEAKITKISELAPVTSKWQNIFQSFYARIHQELKETTQDAIQSLQVNLLLGSIIKVEFEDGEKNQELLGKLDVVLQKLKNVKQL